MDLLSRLKSRAVDDIDITDEDGSNPRKASFYDADTFIDDDDKSYRMPGATAEETWSTMSGILQPAQVGAVEMTEQTGILAKHFGFNRVSEPEGESYDRTLAGLINPSGQRLSDFQIENRLSGANQNTSKEVLTSRMLNSFVDTMNMEFKDSDVTTRSREIIENAIAESGVAPMWKTRADDEEQFALAERLYSHQEIAQLAEDFKNETDPVKKQEMQDALYYAKQTSNPFAASVELRSNDRTIRNKAYKQVGTSLELGLESTAQALFGLGDLIGETSGWDWLEDKGEAGISRSQGRSSEKGTVLTSYNEIEDAGDAFSWIVNNSAMSLPFMGTALAGGLLVAPLGGIAALGATGSLVIGSIPSTILTTGSIWNAMPEGEKSAPIAIAAGFAVGLLDRFGLKGNPKALTSAAAAANKGSMKELFASIQSEVVDTIVATSGMSRSRAVAEVAKASRSQLIKMGDDLGTFASKKLKDLKLAKGIIRQIATATGREAATETVQTAIEEVAAVTGNSAELDPSAFKEALITSAAIGGVYGSGFQMPSITKQYMDRRAILHDVANPDKVAGQLDRFRREDQEESQNDANDPNAERSMVSRNKDQTLQEFEELRDSNLVNDEMLNLVEEGRAASKKEGFIKNSLKAIVNKPGGVFKAHLLNMIEKIGLENENGERRVLLSRLADTLGEININNGLSHQEYIVALRGELTTILPDADTVSQTLNTNKRTANKLLAAALVQIRAGEEVTGPKAREIMSVINAFRSAQFALKQKLEDLGMGSIANELKYDLDILNNRQLDQRKIRANKDEFRAALISAGLTSDAAIRYTDRLLGENATDAAKTLHEQGYTISGDLDSYMSGDIIDSYRSGLSGVAKMAGDTKYLGENNSKLNKVLRSLYEGEKNPQYDPSYKGNSTNIKAQKYLKAEITREQAAQLAVDIQDYLDIANGEYGKWDSPWINSVQDNLILLTFLRGMGFSALASWPELPLTQLGVPQHIAYKHMADHAKQGAKSFAEYINYMGAALPYSPIPRRIFNSAEGKTLEQFEQTPQELLKKLGYTGSDASAVRQYGIELDDWRMVIAEHYAKAVGLNNITDYTRGIRASMASDVINHYVAILANATSSETNMDREAYSELRDLGVDIEFMVNHYQQAIANPFLELTAKEQSYLRENLETGTLRFVDQAIVNPLPGRIPKGYKYKKLAIFNQFQGFIANFTSRILPRILKNIATGSPGVTANALTVSLTMMMTAMFATMLRDEIKYGETTPYLDDYDKFRRVVFASGLLGTGERILAGIDPLYGSRPLLSSDNSVGSTLVGGIEGVFGEAAAYGTIKDAANSVYELGFGDNYKAAKSASKLLPVFGSVNQLRDGLLDNLFNKGN